MHLSVRQLMNWPVHQSCLLEERKNLLLNLDPWKSLGFAVWLSVEVSFRSCLGSCKTREPFLARSLTTWECYIKSILSIPLLSYSVMFEWVTGTGSICGAKAAHDWSIQLMIPGTGFNFLFCQIPQNFGESFQGFLCCIFFPFMKVVVLLCRMPRR